MIANNSVRTAFSLLHLALSLFSFSVCVMYIGIERILSLAHLLQKDTLFIFIDLFLIGSVAFCGFVTWQTEKILLSKRISYFLVFLAIVQCILLTLANSSRTDIVIILGSPLLTASIFVFLLTFSQIGNVEYLQKSIQRDTSNSNLLDIDFLTEKDANKAPSVFWKIHRVFAFSCFILSIFIINILIETSAPKEIIFIPTLFLAGSLLLLFIPKIGSWIFSVVSILSGVGILVIFCVFFLFDLPDNALEKIELVISLSTAVLSFLFLCITLAMLLLSKEAKEEWKTKNKLENQ
ncbi:hypothetical protein WAF17_17050 [Bernardetia sp. ABR2-2B]|uniref:hypothetical protein n=1 Tax=Bernardetia sp. ABR2-2B TaxID=3127472 RepID=UPI0030D3D305